MPVETRVRIVYNPAACQPAVYGCMASDALNYNAAATNDDGTCEWGSDEKTQNFTRQCEVGNGSVVPYYVGANFRVSSVSKADANALRDAQLLIDGQANANAIGNCGDTSPDPQFTGPAVCMQQVPRSASTTKQRKQDKNPISASYYKWLKADGSYVSEESNGDYFPNGSNAEMCRLQGNVTVNFVLRNQSNQVIEFPNGTMAGINMEYVIDGVLSNTSQRSSSSFSRYVDHNTPVNLVAGVLSGSIVFEKWGENTQNPYSLGSGQGFSIDAVFRTI